jgi:hypothetical protein
VRNAKIKSVGASGKITIVEDDDDETDSHSLDVELAPDAILRIGGLPATRGDLMPGMEVPLEFGRDGKFVNGIEAEPGESEAIIPGRLLEVDAAAKQIKMDREEGDEDQPIQQSFKITTETIIRLDGKPAKLVDLRPGCTIRLRLSDDGSSVRAIGAASPEPDDDGEQPEGM